MPALEVLSLAYDFSARLLGVIVESEGGLYDDEERRLAQQLLTRFYGEPGEEDRQRD